MESAFEILELAAGLVTLAVAIYAAVAFPKRKLGLLLAAIILLIASYNVLPLAGEEGFGAWLRHAPVFIGLLLLAIFLQLAAHSGKKTFPSGPAAGVMAGALLSWFQLLTEEGLQHIVVLPFFTVVFIVTIIRTADAPAPVKTALKYFLWAGAAATLIHVMEFIVESQALVPALDGTGVEILELILVYKMLLWFALGIRRSRTAMPAPAGPA